MKMVFDHTGKPALIGRDEHGKSVTVTDGDKGADVIELDAHRPHLLGWVVCPCGHSHLSIVDARADCDALECNGCASMSGALQPNKPAAVVPIR